ncbi:BnaAnng07040D [Brassica napus]|uniref:BnaAnng07040D protein n=1 Tax=Brassica napus TaxID=3708 RepID=A0A078HZW9_BRANA|nr:BnaAnng07040D [Brassica napus]
MMRDRQLFSGLMLILALLSLQNLCHCDDNTVLYESFDEAFDGRWIVSKNGDYEVVIIAWQAISLVETTN